jgi:hypothetical protein
MRCPPNVKYWPECHLGLMHELLWKEKTATTTEGFIPGLMFLGRGGSEVGGLIGDRISQFICLNSL